MLGSSQETQTIFLWLWKKSPLPKFCICWVLEGEGLAICAAICQQLIHRPKSVVPVRKEGLRFFKSLEINTLSLDEIDQFPENKVFPQARSPLRKALSILDFGAFRPA
jgi:hypothetical protein